MPWRLPKIYKSKKNWLTLKKKKHSLFIEVQIELKLLYWSNRKIYNQMEIQRTCLGMRMMKQNQWLFLTKISIVTLRIIFKLSTTRRKRSRQRYKTKRPMNSCQKKKVVMIRQAKKNQISLMPCFWSQCMWQKRTEKFLNHPSKKKRRLPRKRNSKKWMHSSRNRKKFTQKRLYKR